MRFEPGRETQRFTSEQREYYSPKCILPPPFKPEIISLCKFPAYRKFRSRRVKIFPTGDLSSQQKSAKAGGRLDSMAEGGDVDNGKRKHEEYNSLYILHIL